jgi:RecA-family ATPase
MLTQPKPRDPIVENVFDSGTFVELIAPSKCRKSFFALQLANCIATGTKFLAWSVPRPRKVLLVNVELIPDRAHERESAMIRGLGIASNELSRLEIANIRGVKLENPVASICATIREKRPDVCIVDPLYLIHGEDENDQRSMTVVFQELSVAHTAVDCALVVVHHDAKGNPGDRQKRDRGSGTGIMGRFSDSRILLTPHRDDPDGLICVETLCRYFPPQPAITCRFEESRLVVADDIEAAPQTSRHTRTIKSDKAIEDAVNFLIADIIANGPHSSTALRTKMSSKNSGGLGLMTNKTKQSKCFERLKEKASEPGAGFSFVQYRTVLYFGTHERLQEFTRPKAYKDD